jgi:hypothetical protein
VVNVLRRSALIVILLAATTAGVRVGSGQDDGIGARHNSWARFQPGAWKIVRVVTETLDDNAKVISTSVTETKTSLLRLEKDGVVLEVEVGVEIAGRQFDGLPQCVKQGFHGELAGGDVKFLPAATTQIEIEDQKIECRTQQVEVSGSGGRTAIDLVYSDHFSPYVLRRQSKTTDANGGEVLCETVSEVVALNMPQRVLAETRNVACIKTVQKTPKGTVTTLAMASPDIPGGVVSQTTKEIDKTGHVVRRSTLELVSYGTRPENEQRTGLFGRKRPARVRRPSHTEGTWQPN